MDLGPRRGRQPSLNEHDRAVSADGLTIRPRSLWPRPRRRSQNCRLAP